MFTQQPFTRTQCSFRLNLPFVTRFWTDIRGFGQNIEDREFLARMETDSTRLRIFFNLLQKNEDISDVTVEVGSNSWNLIKLCAKRPLTPLFRKQGLTKTINKPIPPLFSTLGSFLTKTISFVRKIIDGL